MGRLGMQKRIRRRIPSVTGMFVTILKRNIRESKHMKVSNMLALYNRILSIQMFLFFRNLGSCLGFSSRRRSFCFSLLSNFRKDLEEGRIKTTSPKDPGWACLNASLGFSSPAQ